MSDLTTEEALLFIQVPHRLIHTVMHGYKVPREDMLCKSHIRTLVTLENHGPVSMHTLGEWVGIPKGSFTQVVDKLVKEGLIERRRSPEDRRVVLVSITEAGRRATRRLDERLSGYLKQILKVLTEDEKREILDALRNVQRVTQLIEERKNAS